MEEENKIVKGEKLKCGRRKIKLWKREIKLWKSENKIVEEGK